MEEKMKNFIEKKKIYKKKSIWNEKSQMLLLFTYIGTWYLRQLKCQFPDLLR